MSDLRRHIQERQSTKQCKTPFKTCSNKVAAENDKKISHYTNVYYFIYFPQTKESTANEKLSKIIL